MNEDVYLYGLHPEYWTVRGIGLDNCTCFVCGGSDELRENISGYVSGRMAGERVVKMFGGPERAWLDFRTYEPEYVQVKVGACEKHAENLRLLYTGVIGQSYCLTEKLIEWAKDPEGSPGYKPVSQRWWDELVESRKKNGADAPAG